MGLSLLRFHHWRVQLSLAHLFPLFFCGMDVYVALTWHDRLKNKPKGIGSKGIFHVSDLRLQF